MNEIIQINYESENPTVSARDLHEALEVGTRFNDSKTLVNPILEWDGNIYGVYPA